MTRLYEEKRNRGFCGLALYSPLFEANIGIVLRSAQVFGVDFINLISTEKYKRQRTDTSNVTRHVPTSHYSSYEEFERHLPLNTDVVGVELSDKSRNLRDFVWPPRPCIVLGSEREGIPPELFKRCRYKVQLPLKPSINLSAMASIVLYDRWSKLSEKGLFDVNDSRTVVPVLQTEQLALSSP